VVVAHEQVQVAVWSWSSTQHGPLANGPAPARCGLLGELAVAAFMNSRLSARKFDT
jgi:hypothetical protein